MKKIVCELCEGTEFTKENGMFVCHGCGTRYTVEEAKSMMREVEGDAPAVTPAAPAPAPVMPAVNPNQQQIDNFLLLATNAYEADNRQEAENYCNQAISLDAMNYKAWFLKGKAVGWSSTSKKPRVEEAAHSFCKAIDFAPEEEKEELKSQAVDELKRLGIAMIVLRKNLFVKYPDDEELKGFDTDRALLLDALTVLLNHGNSVGMPEGYLEEIAKVMNIAAVGGYTTARNKFNDLHRPGPSDWKKAVNSAVNCITLLQKAIDASDKDDEGDILRYENIIVINDFIMNLKAYSNYSSTYRDYYLTDESYNLRKKWEAEWKEKIEALKKSLLDKKAAEEKRAEEEKKARIKAYWEAHAEEKEALEAERKELEEKIEEWKSRVSSLEKQVNKKVPTEEELDKLGDQIKSLENRRANLGLFAGKEKKQITEEIATLYGRVDSLKSRASAERKAKDEPLNKEKQELNAEINKATKRIAAINAEFEKDPEEK